MDGLTSTCSWNDILAITIGITIYARRLVLKAESKRQDPEAVPPCCIVGSLTEPRCKSRSQDDGSSQIHQDACSVRLRSATQSRLVKLESRNQGEADTPKNRGRSAGRVRPKDVTPLALIRITDASARIRQRFPLKIREAANPLESRRSVSTLETRQSRFGR